MIVGGRLVMAMGNHQDIDIPYVFDSHIPVCRPKGPPYLLKVGLRPKVEGIPLNTNMA